MKNSRASCIFVGNGFMALKMKIFVSAFAFFVFAVSAFCISPVQQYADRIVSEDLASASVGILAISGDGDTLVCINPGKLLLPASNMKLVTTGLALHVLGADFMYETELRHSGTISDGVLDGNLYIRGGGDPTLASDDSIALPADKLFAQWAKILSDNGINRIDGHIIGDDRHFSVMPEVQSWQWDDCGTYYGTGVSGLSFYENVQTFRVSAGAAPGDSVSIVPMTPECPWMSFDFSKSSTGEAGTGDKLYYYTSRYAPFGEMRGTFAVDRKPKTLECSNKFPAYTCAYLFSEYLGCAGGAGDSGYFRPEDLPSAGEPTEKIGSTFSPSLGRIAFETNYESNNLYAEALYLTLGKAMYGDDSKAGAAVASALASLGLDASSVEIKDGSGLSRQNMLSPEFLCSFLSAMKKSPAFGDFLKSLPYPGSNGTMSNVMHGYDASGLKRILLKSGSMTGVKCFSGYILPSDGKPEDAAVFSIMINNSQLSQYRMQLLVDRLLHLLLHS